MENLDRGVVAVKVPGGVYVGWRMFAYEYGVSGVAYNLYRDGTSVKILVGTPTTWTRPAPPPRPTR
jgi:hypothetical protein